MPNQGNFYRILAILLAAAVIVIPTAVYLSNENVDLRGSAILQSDEEPAGDAAPQGEEQSSSNEEPGGSDEGSSEAEDSEPSAAEQPDSSDSEPSEQAGTDENNFEENESEQTDAGEDTQTDAVDETQHQDEEEAEQPDSEDQDAEATEDSSDSGDDSENEPNPEATEDSTDTGDSEPDYETTPQPAPSPDTEVTQEPVSDATPEPETTAEPEAEATPELTPEATFVQLEVSYTCSAAGVDFTVTNLGGNMQQSEPYSIDDTSSGDLQLSAGESATINAGYGTPGLSVGGATAQPDEPCLPPPALEVSAVCVAEQGVVFVIVNSGGPMPEPQPYLIDGESTGDFQLSEGSTAELEAGYGRPLFTSGDLSAMPEETCNPPGSVTGTVWLDANGDGERSEDESALTEINVILTMEDGSVLEQLTGDDGSYWFEYLLPGTYTIQIPVFPAEMLPSYDYDGGNDSGALVIIETGQVIADFGYQPEPRGSISGLVWSDLDGDGVQGENEAGLPGVNLTLSQSGTDTFMTATTDAAGVYAFTDLPAGDYILLLAAETIQEGFEAISEPDEEIDGVVALTLEAGRELTDLNFVFQPLPVGHTISGTVWADLNGDGRRDENEPGLAGIKVALVGMENMVEITTDASGMYQFIDLAAADYTISLSDAALADNFAPTTNPDGESDAAALITVADSDIEKADFGLQPIRFGSISGLVWLEIEEFGVRNASESGLAGIDVDLLDSSGTVIQTVTLTADGLYQFTDLLPGSYTISINVDTLPDRMFITYNPDGSDQFSTTLYVPSGTDVGNIEFGVIGTF